jgi:hypothetical protein
MMPRNAALGIVLDDLLNDGGNPGDPGYPGSVTASNVRVVTGYPPLVPFGVRVLPDPNHGALVGNQFHSTRVIVDMSVSTVEALGSGVPVNAIGLPEATSVAEANVGLRVPTQVNVAAQQFDVVRNLAGASLSFTGNGATDPLSPTLDIVRAFRSGGKTPITGDPYNGFLRDELPPSVLIEVLCSITSVHPTAVPTDLRVSIRFPDPDCHPRLHVGDVVYTATSAFRLTQVGATSAKVHLLAGSVASLVVGPAQYVTNWRLGIGAGPACALRFLPTPGNPPNKIVSNQSSIVVSFSEPIDPASVSAFDSFAVTRNVATSPIAKYVPGHIAPSNDLLSFTFTPELPLAHVMGQGERYRVELGGGSNGVTDLAGNPLAFDLPPVEFQLDATQPTFNSGSVVLRFSANDEDGNGAPEVRGQVTYDLAHGQLRPRPVTHFSAVADPSVPVVGAMIPIQSPIQTPLSNHGSKMMGVWRYHDLGFGLRDEATQNLDIEGLSWALFFSGLQVDNFTQFQMSLAHSRFLPDEAISSGLLPNFPSSGLVAKFQDNLLDAATDPLTVVHPKAKGYNVGGAGSVFTVPSGLTMTHWPWNQNTPVSNYTYWTWRDTGKLATGAPAGAGADTGRLWQVTKSATPSFYPAAKVPTIGLPLLMEYRTYADALASGQNGFRIAIAINSSAMPFFRAHSTGGVLLSGQIVTIDPDTEVTANGGINPATGAHTQPRDNSFYYGQGDFVVRVSRAHTVWFDTSAGSQFAAPIIEPGSTDLPAGTQIVVAYRGASTISSVTANSWSDASNLDAYGDSYTAVQLPVIFKSSNLAFTPTFVNSPPAPQDKRWHTSIQELNGARYVQARFSFFSNAETNATAQLSTLAVAFQH